jgi:hypothetical protein
MRLIVSLVHIFVAAVGRRNAAALRWLLILSSFALLAAAYRAGIAAGLDSYIAAHAAGPFLIAVCAVATKWLTGVGDYVCLEKIQDIVALRQGILQDLGLRMDGHSWEYLFDREFVDQALRRLFEMPHWAVPSTTSGPPYLGVQGIGWGMDEGHYVFVNLAFHIFGPAVDSLYRGYWLLYGASSVLFALAYRRSIAPLVLLAASAVFQYMVFSTDFLWFSDGIHPTTAPSSPRFLSCLGVLPALHFVCAAWIREPLRWREATLLSLQGVILGIAILQRTTVQWVLVAAVLLSALHWIFRRHSPSYQLLKRRYYLLLGGIFGIVLLTNVYLAVTSHPGLAANGYVARHNVWHALFYNLQTHPDWKARYGAEYDNKDGDFLPIFAGRRYLANHPDEWARWNPDRGDPFQIAISQVGIEYLIKQAFVEFARRDPGFALQTWTYYNPSTLYYYSSVFLRQYLAWMPAGLLAGLIGLGFLCGVTASAKSSRQMLASIPILALLCLISVLPNWATVVIQTSMTDCFELLAILATIVLVDFGLTAGLAVRAAVVNMEARAAAATGRCR